MRSWTMGICLLALLAVFAMPAEAACPKLECKYVPPIPDDPRPDAGEPGHYTCTAGVGKTECWLGPGAEECDTMPCLLDPTAPPVGTPTKDYWLQVLSSGDANGADWWDAWDAYWGN